MKLNIDEAIAYGHRQLSVHGFIDKSDPVLRQLVEDAYMKAIGEYRAEKLPQPEPPPMRRGDGGFEPLRRTR